MPPKQRVVVQSSSPSQQSQGGYFKTAYNGLTDPENATVVRSVVVFGVSLKKHAILAHCWSG